MADIKFMVMGVRSQTVALDVREQFSIAQDHIPKLLADLVASSPAIHEALLVTTCNRTEWYLAMEDTEAALIALQQFWVRYTNLSLELVMNHTFTYLNQDAVLHLFRVASGLDSLIVGESQIIAQVKDAWQLAQRAGTASYYLDKLINTALAVSKRVRTETGIEQKDTSVSAAAIQYLQKRAPHLLERPILLLGGGKVAEQLLLALKTHNAAVTLVNRSQERLQQLTDTYHVNGVTWDQVPTLLPQTHTLLVATGAPHVVVDDSTLEGVSHELWVLDLSVPRNVCTSVSALPYVTLLNTDDLGVEQCHHLRHVEGLAERAIAEGYRNFEAWWHSLPVLPTLTRFRHKLEQLRQEQLSEVSAEFQPMVDQFSRSLINKILHGPTVRLKQTQDAQLHLERLFDLTSQIADPPNVGTI
jgi:glutamyl-tRNA reductase